MYGFTEAGFLGCGCACGAGSDRMHLFSDAFAAIPGGAAEQVLFTTLLDCTPKILLNVGVGDTATLIDEPCDCRFGRLGLTQQLADVHSTSRLTVQGMTYPQRLVVPIVEELLPAEFGGGPGDYQLLEEETPDGRTRLLLLVAPRVGPVDTNALTDRLLSALGALPGGHCMMADLWRQAGAVRIVRRAPTPTQRGKVIPVQTLRPPRQRNGT
jgi:hypothetical protein